MQDVRGMKRDEADCLSSMESYLLYSVSSRISAIIRYFYYYQFSSFAPPSFASDAYQRVSPLAAFPHRISRLSMTKGETWGGGLHWPIGRENSKYRVSFNDAWYRRVELNQRKSNLRRNNHNRFEDNDLAELLFDAVETLAGSPGAKAVPEWAREQEILKLKRARQANVCTLNEFRQYLGLERVFTIICRSRPASLFRL